MDADGLLHQQAVGPIPVGEIDERREPARDWADFVRAAQHQVAQRDAVALRLDGARA